MPSALSKAQATLLCQVVGDSLGSLVEFESAQTISVKYPDGVRYLADGGTYETLAGQPTDDSELALLLARELATRNEYNPQVMRERYRYWLDSKPFDCGRTTSRGILGNPDLDSQANGALMRVSPLGIFGAKYDLQKVFDWAVEDAKLTHPNLICLQVNALYALGISKAIQEDITSRELHDYLSIVASDFATDQVFSVFVQSISNPPPDFMANMGWVITAFWNALYQMLHAPSLEAGIVDTVNRGGDTDTNGAIAGALLGAIYGMEAVPQDWKDTVLQCKPSKDNPRSKKPRPQCFWPCDVLDLATKLLGDIPNGQ